MVCGTELVTTSTNTTGKGNVACSGGAGCYNGKSRAPQRGRGVWQTGMTGALIAGSGQEDFGERCDWVRRGVTLYHSKGRVRAIISGMVFKACRILKIVNGGVVKARCH